jgi:hypothetical protein
MGGFFQGSAKSDREKRRHPDAEEAVKNVVPTGDRQACHRHFGGQWLKSPAVLDGPVGRLAEAETQVTGAK